MIAVGAGVLVVGALVTSLWTVEILLVPVVVVGVLFVMLLYPSRAAHANAASTVRPLCHTGFVRGATVSLPRVLVY